MKRSWNDALWIDGEKRMVVGMDRVFVLGSAVSRRTKKVFVRDNTNRAGMSGFTIHKTEKVVDKQPITIEEGRASIDEVLKDGEDVRMRSR
jgi:hypothetical protein